MTSIPKTTKRVRAVAVLVKNDEVLLIHRRNTKEYYVFPGGGVEEGESVEQAVLRELKEETSITAEIIKLLRHTNDAETENYVYLCQYIAGEPKLDENSPEKQKMLKGVEYYNPVWIKVQNLENLLVYPLEAQNLLIEDFKNNFFTQQK